jgi:hypothetical protein
VETTCPERTELYGMDTKLTNRSNWYDDFAVSPIALETTVGVAASTAALTRRVSALVSFSSSEAWAFGLIQKLPSGPPAPGII